VEKSFVSTDAIFMIPVLFFSDFSDAPTLADCVSEWGIAKITEKQNRDHKNGIR